MRRRSAQVVFAVAVLLTMPCAEPASAGQPDPFAGLSPGGLTGGLNLPGGGSGGSGGGTTVSGPGSTAGGSAPSTSQYAYVPTGRPCSQTGPGTGAVPGVPGYNPAANQGTVNAQVLVTGGQQQLVTYICVLNGTAPPPPPPPPPTPAEIWAHVPLSSGSIGVSPPTEGVTGMDTWFWYRGDTNGVGLSVSIRGYTVQLRAKPVKFTWNSGDGAQGTGPSPGSDGTPGFTHVYETKGDYTIQIVAAWEGSYTFSGYGVSSGGSLGSVSVTSTRPYHVYEVRGVLG